IPLQSGSDDMLKRMNRNYGTREFHSLVRKLRSYIPDIGISLDVIVGHPGETEASFRETLAFLNDIKPSRLHVFSYSDRKGTASFEMKDRVPKDVTKHRVEETIQKGEALKGEFCERFLGREVEVLVEKRSEEGIFEGYTSEYLRTKIYGFEGSKGDIVKIEVDDLDKISSCLMAGKGVFA
ncbi:MAG: radical SAM protein, partial [Candidatus Omnitrophica bacterium]|nr:radical SAM protein [Candidatus Omnitrophota bacterium]